MAVTQRTWTTNGKKRQAWQVSVSRKGPDGRSQTYRKTDAAWSWDEARAEEARVRAAMVDGTWEPTKPVEAEGEATTLAEFAPRFIERCKAEGHKASGIHGKEVDLRVHILPALGSLPLDQIGPEQINKFKMKIQTKDNGKPRKAKTQNTILSVLGALMKTAAEYGVIVSAPRVPLIRHVPKPEVSAYDDETYDWFIETAEKIDTRIKIALLLAGDAGLRLGELVGLEWQDIDLKAGILSVNRSVWEGIANVPKSGKPRQIPLTDRLKKALKQQAHHIKTNRVLYRDDGTPVDRDTVASWVRRCERRMAMPETGRVHKFRHSFLTSLAARGAPGLAVQHLAGHAHLSTTERYLHLPAGLTTEAIRLLNGRGQQHMGQHMSRSGKKKREITEDFGGSAPESNPQREPQR
jgi:integrase